MATENQDYDHERMVALAERYAKHGLSLQEAEEVCKALKPMLNKIEDLGGQVTDMGYEMKELSSRMDND